MTTIHILIKGKVQGVFYRVTAKDVADDLNLKGWIKNTDEGNVEVTISGDEPSLQKFTEWCKQGPPKAQVDEVIVSKKPETNFSYFKVIRS